MKETLLLPFNLTSEIAYHSISQGIEKAFAELIDLMPRKHLHIVVLVEGIDTSGVYPNYPLTPVLLTEKSYNKNNWSLPYSDIARSKALQKYQGRNSDEFGTQTPAHLLYDMDTVWSGAVSVQRIVVSCSGDSQENDVKISRYVANACISNARKKWARSHFVKNKNDFLSQEEDVVLKKKQMLISMGFPNFEDDSRLLNTEISLIDFGKYNARIQNVLRDNEIVNLADLLWRSKKDLLKFRNMGRTILDSLEDYLKSQDLKFKMNIDWIIAHSKKL